jgi:hypothetical protein
VGEALSRNCPVIALGLAFAESLAIRRPYQEQSCSAKIQAINMATLLKQKANY